MFNDDPYGRQRVKPPQGVVGGAPVVAGTLTRPQAAPALPPNAARTSLPPSSIIKPPTPYATRQPQTATAPAPALASAPRKFGSAADALSRPHATLAEAAKPASTLGQVVAGAVLSPLGQSAIGMPPQASLPQSGVPEQPSASARPAMGAGNGALLAPARPKLDLATPPPFSPPAAAPAVPAVPAVPVQDRTMLGPMKRAQQPGEVGRSVAGRQLPGAPTVGADGSVQYDQAFMDRNKTLIDQYQKQNAVQTVVPGAGVAQSMATGGNMQNGALTRPPRGFTNEDRAAQLEGLRDLGNQYRQSRNDDRMTFARMYAAGGDTERAEAITNAVTAGSSLATSPPPTVSSQAVGAQAMARQNQAAAAGNAAASLAMEQDAARMEAEQQGLQTKQEQIKLQNAQQMQDLTQRLLAGDKQAEAQIAKLTKQDPGNPMKVAVPIGADEMGKPITADGIWQDGQLVFDPRSAGQGANGMQPIPYSEALDALRANDTPERRAAFQSVYNVDPVRILGR